MTRDEAEALEPKVQAALREFGADVRTWVQYFADVDAWEVCTSQSECSGGLHWMALNVAMGAHDVCWPCYRAGTAGDGNCGHDPWLSERPRLERAR